MSIVERIEWENEKVRLVSLGGIQKADRFPKGDATNSRFIDIPHRTINEVIIHQSAGNFKAGLDAVEGIARFHAGRPKYKRDSMGNVLYRKVRGKKKPHRIGGGRGWPGIAYTFVVPAMPVIADGKVVVYRCWPDSMKTWHTGGVHNRNGVGVCVAGTYTSRHHNSTIARDQPDPLAMLGLEGLVLDYLLPRYGLGPDALMGHFDAGKPACPGDYLEWWVRTNREENWANPLSTKGDSAHYLGKLETAEQRQKALIWLGYDLGSSGKDSDGADGMWGEVSRSALESFQEYAGIKSDGYWGPVTERALRTHLIDYIP